MHRFLFYVILTTFAAPSVFAQTDTDEPVDLTDALHMANVWLDAQQEYNDLPGIATAIVKGDSTVWAAAYGYADREAGVPLTPETQFHIASISKTFAAVAVMTLVDAGRLRLDDPIEDHLPWFQPPPRSQDNAPITVRRVLTHSAGLTREIEKGYWSDIESLPPAESLYPEFSAETLYPAETVLQYSNLGYMLLGELVAEVAGMPYNDYLHRAVLVPLGLEVTVASYPSSAYGTRHAVGYSSRRRDGTYQRLPYNPSERIASMGGLSSTVLDLAAYATWQFRLLKKDASAEVLRPSTLRSMHRVHFTDADWETTWGLGFMVTQSPDGSTDVHHGGYFPGHKTHLLLHPSSETAFVVAINTSGQNPRVYTRGLKAIVEKAAPIPEDAEGLLTRDRLAEYAGFYNYIFDGSEVAIVPWEGQLAAVDLPTDNPAEAMTVYKHVEGDTFRRVREDNRPGETITFRRDADGRVEAARTFSYELNRQRK